MTILLKSRKVIYFQTDKIIIYNDDFLTLDYIKYNSIDLIVTSPPYNVDIKYNSYDDTISYFRFTLSLLKIGLLKLIDY